MTHCYFSESSRDIQLLEDGRKLKALCGTTSGHYYESIFDLNYYLANLNGQIRFAGVDKFPGAYTNSCSNVTLERTILKGGATRNDGITSWFAVDLDKNIRNTEGRLTWVVDPSKELDDPVNDAGGFGSYLVNHSHSEHVRVARAANITPPGGANDIADIQHLIALWTHNSLDPGLRQRSEYVTFPRRPGPHDYRPSRNGWRIDIQENGAFPRTVNGVSYMYYNVAVQNGSPVYANVLIPVNYNVGVRRIRNALNLSLQQGTVVVINPPDPNSRPIPPQMEEQARRPFVESLLWTIVAGVATAASLVLL